MAVLRTPAVSFKKFMWTGTHGTCEISDLGPQFKFGRVYDDACDVGLTVMGREESVVFCENSVDMDASGEDIAGWRLVSINAKTGRPDGRFTLLIIND